MRPFNSLLFACINPLFHSRSLKGLLSGALMTAGLMATSAPFAVAEPWVNAGDSRTKHHLNVINDAGGANTPTSSWPIMWSDIKASLDSIDPRDLSAQALWSYQYLRHELRMANRSSGAHKNVYASNAPLGIGHFGSQAREQYEANIGIDFISEKFAAKLSATFVHNPTDEREYRADGSYAAYLFGNWAAGFGAIDRWWGPGWESSLILSNNARPIPGLFLQRRRATAFETPWLSWLGPWQLSTFMGELENNRHIPDARLWGMRINFRPLQSLEIGLSRTAQWGGDGRPGDMSTFYRMLLGQDNKDDTNEDDNKEPGNQLAGVDFRWGFTTGNLSNALYAQLIGEDEAGGMPSRHIGMAGLETSTLLYNTQIRFSLEGQNTTVYFYDSEDNPKGDDIRRPAYNSAYEHSLYKTGYRYLGRPIGASTDNDSESYTARAQLYFSNGHRAQMAFAKHLINKDGRNKSIGGNVFGSAKISDTIFTIEYNVPLSNQYEVTLGLFNHSTPIYFNDKKIDSGGYLNLKGNW